MWFDVALLLISLGVILVAAGFFTNGVEWLGKKFRLTEGAVGSILAAVGTAMPETIIPLIAILFGGGRAGEQIGIGAILGAPFMLGTLAVFVSGSAVLAFKGRRRNNFPRLEPAPPVICRDLGFFLVVYSLAVGSAFLPAFARPPVAVGLILVYFVFAYRTITGGVRPDGEEEEALEPLYLGRSCADPPLLLVVLQVALAFAGIVAGAKVFVGGVTVLSSALGVPAFIFSLLVAPLATEMPEKLNSVIWLYRRRDTLALGNITGAMVFQSSIIPALGMLLTPWTLTDTALLSAGLALVSALTTYLFIRLRGFLDARLLVFYGGAFYAAFVAIVLTGALG